MYSIRRRVIYIPGSQETQEVWGIDRPAPRIRTVAAPRFTDEDDPLGAPCSLLLRMQDGDYVSWYRLPEWLGEAEAVGYEVVSGLAKLTPYSVILLREKSLLP